MKILYDDEIFFRQKFGGVSKIFSLLLEALQKEDNIDILFKNTYSENEYLLDLGLNQIKPFLKNKTFPLKGKLIRAVCGFYGHKYVNKVLEYVKPDIFHPTFYSNYFLNSISNKTKLVITIHDLIHEKFPPNNHYKELAKIKHKNLQRADAVITVSENTKKDLLELYPFVQKEKVIVNHLSENISEVIPKPIEILPENYILFVGERSGYKNFETVAKAFANLSISFPQMYLFCSGSQPFNEFELNLLNQLNIKSRVIQKSLSIGELKYAYTHAKVFVFPSKYEGFGIPVLESFACKTPVIISNTGSLPEIAEDAALSFNPNNSDDLSEKIIQIITNKQLALELIEKGNERLKNFSWKKHIDKTIQLYKTIL